MCGAFAESRRGQTSRFIKAHTMACVGVVVAVVVVHDVFWGGRVLDSGRRCFSFMWSYGAAVLA